VVIAESRIPSSHLDVTPALHHLFTNFKSLKNTKLRQGLFFLGLGAPARTHGNTAAAIGQWQSLRVRAFALADDLYA